MRISRKKSKIWPKLAAAVAGLFIIAGATIIFASASHGTRAPRFEMSVSAPAPASFDNDISADFIGPNAMPDVNNNRGLNVPGELVISYNQTSGDYTPALRMDANDADIAAAVKITPAIAGTWSRRGPNALTFRPTHNWPADVKFSVKINKSILNPDARVNSLKTTFKTPAMVATVESFNTYPATQPQSVVGVAVVSFNYPAETKQLAGRTIMRLDGDKIDFSVKFDRFHRTAVITSAPIKITDAPQTLRIKINRIPTDGGNAQSQKITANTTIESADNIFKISELNTTVADDKHGIPNQLLLINMTAAAEKNVKWPEYVNTYLLPRNSDQDTDTDEPHKWADDEITDAVIKKSTKLTTTTVDFENPLGVYQYALSYDVSEPDDRFIYAVVRAGIPSAAGFKLKNGATRVMRVPYPARSVKIAGTGALLALGGDKKLGITARGGADAAYVNLYKVKSNEINHLISQTYNIFGDVEFKGWSFDAYDLAAVFKKRIGFADPSPKQVNYASVDLGDYLDRTNNDKTGIFIIQTGPTQSHADYSDRRLILLTDLGIVRKINLDQSSTVFISTLTSGEPAADTEIYVLGRNGNAVWAGRTDDGGRADIPNLPWNEYRNEKAPVAIVARRENDVSFIPYDNPYDRRVEYSKFDIDGTYASATTALNAFLFTDRGIYRPGESVIIGGIVKNKSFKPLPGVPVRLEIRDARGRIIFEKTFSMTADGMFDVKYTVPQTAPVGEYNFQLFSLNSKNKPLDILGHASFRVEEFIPDTMKITASIPGMDDAGWIAPDALNATVSLHNMFGTPAANKRVSARLILTPAAFDFKNFSGYKFTDNFISGTGMGAHGAAKTITREIDDIVTNPDGAAEINMADTDISNHATYAMTLIVRGFESGTGRSVQTAISGRVSRAEYLIGWHANSDLAYINRGAARSVNFIAIDHTATRTTASDVTMRVMRRENLTSLVKDSAGYYKYQTISRDKIIAENNITITERGMDANLDTSVPGTYFIQIINAAGDILANVEYFVAGDENTALDSDTNAELNIKLNAASYAPGDDIAISITAPYTGYGLITIERDKVYAYRWFRTENTRSVQHIAVPAGFEGTGYVNVSFVRDINSRDIFTTPYTYAVAPFAARNENRTIGVKLTTPDIITDNKLPITYETNRDARIMIFAVNTGILQVARYQIPRPIAHFFKKAALQVETYQILSLILPEYKILREFAKTGGGDYNDMDGGTAIAANPFARKNDAPVAFYSEIITTHANKPGTITFDIPDAFNGEMRVFAVASDDSGTGAADTTVTVRHPIIVAINAPLAVAPNDTFDIATVISNLTDDKDSKLFDVTETATPGIQITTAPTTKLNIPAGADHMWHSMARATDVLGPAEIRVGVHTDAFDATGTATLSVRPTTPFTTDIQSGVLDGKKTTLRPTNIDMYTDNSSKMLYISYGADAMVRPLVEYLNNYQWTCTEQLTSRAMPYAAIGASDILGISYDVAAAKIADTISTLKNRQNDDGSFAMWASSNNNGRNNERDDQTAYITAYVVQFLDLARAGGFDVPQDMMARALDYLRTYAGTTINNADEANAHAFAIYVITANEYVTTAYIGQFEEWANANMKNWESELAGQYIAAAYAIMHQDDRAAQLASKYKTIDAIKYTSTFDNTVANNAIREYLVTKYLGHTPAMPSAAQIKYINSGEYSSFNAAALILAYAGNTGNKNAISDAITVTIDGTPITAQSASGAFAANIPKNAKKIDVTCPDCGSGMNLYWTITQQGYPKSVKPQSNGLDIVREYYDMDGNRIDRAKIGDRVTVKIFARTRGDVAIAPNAVIVDILPGGFIADGETLAGDYDFADVREDRVIIYADITRSESVYSYIAQVGAAGTFAIAPIHAVAMYNPAVNATGRGGTFTGINEKGN